MGHPSNNAPAVSIITPAYNSAAFLPATVAGARAQTFTDFELLIVDDGSRDDTLEVARGLAAADSRIRVLATVNGGAALARNTAMAVARGQFFALLDSDDVWWPGYLERQLALLKKFPDVSVVTANAINHGGPRDGTPLWPRTAGLRRLGLHDALREENAISIMSVFRRTCVEVAGGFDPEFNGNEDYHFWIRVLRAGFVVMQCGEPIAFYRRRPGSVSDDERQMLKGIIRILQWAHDGSPSPGELAIINRQIARFTRELQLADAKAHLVRGEFREAADAFAVVSSLSGDLYSRLVAQTSRRAPATLRWAYQTLSAMRAGRRATSPS
jgi:glycosyltransferase involved in cell wall biosynthesis